jgi:hypothetical protein
MAQNAVDAASLATDPAVILKSVNFATSELGMSEDEARSKIGIGAMKAAAEAGDTKAFEAAASVLEGRSTAEQLRLEGTLRETINQKTTEARRAAENDVASLYNARRDDPSITFGEIRGRIGSLRKDGMIDADTADRLYREADGREAKEIDDAKKAIKKVEIDSINADYLTRAREIVRNARTTGGAGIITDQTVTLSDGTEHKISGQEIAEAAFNAEMEAAPNFAAQAEMAALNNKVYRPWQSTLGAGYSAGTAAFFSAQNGGRVELAASTRAGLDLYENLTAQNPVLREKTVPDENADLFYLRASLARKYITQGDADQALLLALNATTATQGQVVSINSVAEYATWTDDDDARNPSEAQGKIKELATLLTRSPGLTEEDAIIEASTRIRETHSLIGGRWVYTGDKTDRESLPQLSKALAERYKNAYGYEDEELDASDIGLAPAGVPGFWVLYDNRGPVPVPVKSWNNPRVGVYDDNELWIAQQILGETPGYTGPMTVEAARRIKEAKDAKAISESVERARVNREARNSPLPASLGNAAGLGTPAFAAPSPLYSSDPMVRSGARKP